MFIIICIIVSLLPMSLFFLSLGQLKNPESNYIIFKTKRSILSEESRNYGQKFIAKLWCLIGPLMLVESLYLLFKYREFFKLVSLYLIIFQVSTIWLTVIPVELRLKRKFDDKGNPLNRIG